MLGNQLGGWFVVVQAVNNGGLDEGGKGMERKQWTWDIFWGVEVTEFGNKLSIMGKIYILVREWQIKMKIYIFTIFPFDMQNTGLEPSVKGCFFSVCPCQLVEHIERD